MTAQDPISYSILLPNDRRPFFFPAKTHTSSAGLPVAAYRNKLYQVSTLQAPSGHISVVQIMQCIWPS